MENKVTKFYTFLRSIREDLNLNHKPQEREYLKIKSPKHLSHFHQQTHAVINPICHKQNSKRITHYRGMQFCLQIDRMQFKGAV